MFINTTETLGIIIGTATQTTTGNIFLTLLILMLFLVTVAMLFGIRLEFTAILILPILLSYMAYYGDYVGVGSVIIIYLALIFTTKFIILFFNINNSR